MRNLVVLLVLLSLSCRAHAVRGRYDVGDWVSWTSMRYLNDLEGYQHMLYVASDGGIARFDTRASRWLRPLTTSDGLVGRRILSVAVDPSFGDLHYQTDRGSSRFSVFNERDIGGPASVGSVAPRERAPNAIPPVGFHYTPNGVLMDEDLRRYEAVDVIEDFWKNVWIGFRGYGIGYVDRYSRTLELHEYGLWNDDLRALDYENDTFWFVGDAAINAHNRDRDTWWHFEAFNNSDILSDNARDVIVEPETVWVATDQGLSRYNRLSGRWRTLTRFDGLPDSDVLCIAADTASIWIGTAFGIARLDRGARRATDVSYGSYPERMIHDIAVGDSAVWVGTDVGLLRSRNRGRTWNRTTMGEPILDAPVYRIYVAGDELWCATRLGVIGYNVKTQTAERYPAGVYFAPDTIRGPTPRFLSILAADSLIWVGTDLGLYRCDRRQERWRVFTTADGLIDDHIYDIEREGDYLWLATPRGVTRFYWNSPYRVD